MVNIPIIQDVKTSPFAGFLGGIGKGLGEAVPTGIENRMISQAMEGLDINDPSSMALVLNRASPMLRPKIAELISKQQQLSGVSEEKARARETFEQKTALTEQQKLLNQQKIQQGERARDFEFSNLVNERLQGLDDIGKSAFIDMSQQYANERDPNRRYQKTLKFYDQQMQSTQALTNKLNTIGKVRKGWLGLKENDLNMMSRSVEKLLEDGVDTRLIENSLRQTGINNSDFEAMMTPNFSTVKKIIDSVKAPRRKIIPGQVGIVGSVAEITDEDISKTSTILSKAIQKGASLDYIFTVLKEKRYSDTDAQKIISDATATIDLTPRQNVQLNNLQRLRRATLQKIFGA